MTGSRSGMTGSRSGMTGMIDKYIAYIRDVRRYSPRTQELYEKALQDFTQWGGELIPSRIREYEAQLIEQGLKPRTVHLYMSALSGYCNYLIKEGQLKRLLQRL